ncbi:hypothetical protein HDE68_000360 [Pedobacter cryoconitis]|uniref:Uncharacterized protein n=1 Tax=Pedobacter cryoconitis TaxID=188932 RepID=A0A7W8ZIE6_9SPHI|nr:hypothetical protein [Pedobacter cryoconitis]
MILDTLLLELVIKVSGSGKSYPDPVISVLTLVIFVLLIASLFV